MKSRLINIVLLFLTLFFMISYIQNYFLTSVEPVITTEVALQQMENTTSGHVVARTHLNIVQILLYSKYLLILISAVVVYIVFRNKEEKTYFSNPGDGRSFCISEEENNCLNEQEKNKYTGYAGEQGGENSKI
jgi:hypothetical protein